MLKKIFLLSIIVFLSYSANAQLSIGYHQSDLSFVEFSYNISDRFAPGLRLGTNRNLEDVTIEGVLAYNYLLKEEYNLYIGLGLFAGSFGAGASLPLGMQIYPFENQKFGFHLEAAPIIIGEGSQILRGSWGIRYRFLQE